MPEISRFYGITIKVFFEGSEHDPPHIHAYYSGYEASIDIRTLKVIGGKLPKKALHLVLEWVKLHQGELLTIWKQQKFTPVKPLE